MSSGDHKKATAYLMLLRNELSEELPNIKKIPIQNVQNINFPHIEKLNSEQINQSVIDSTRKFIRTLNKVYIRIYNNANDAKDNLIRDHEKTPADKFNFLELKRRYHNEKLTEFVENNTELVRIIEYKGRLFQKSDPIYLDPVHPFIKAHFYAPRKMVFGSYYSTFWVNVGIIWAYSFLLYIMLYFRVLKRMLDFLEQIISGLKQK
jgi:hypothetical protein